MPLAVPFMVLAGAWLLAGCRCRLLVLGLCSPLPAPCRAAAAVCRCVLQGKTRGETPPEPARSSCRPTQPCQGPLEEKSRSSPRCCSPQVPHVLRMSPGHCWQHRAAPPGCSFHTHTAAPSAAGTRAVKPARGQPQGSQVLRVLPGRPRALAQQGAKS